ncbi:outer membrane beta-barrel family protein [Chitinophaga nivalis]|uniref:TonB-dependent receptor family protein n=1 Tax=Chitinophaga nivalis TaxID=2991709 RepID=A0ABT3IQJ3_9BACT|nr:outer membrane beta-barrel family protein [Chitinophaga nivalis]MCW3464080.1 TonB-dependent receptor family protein [Chitinophaga nivalis]MCW3486230.1 TonB-dependent receptor family protein [Chitinophaga nivalis]
MKKSYAVLAGIFLWQLHTYAQAPETGKTRTPQPTQDRPNRPVMPMPGRLYGKLLDAQTGKPVPYASVTLLKQRDSSLVTGMLTKANGDFSLEGLAFGTYIMRINFMGYNSVQKKVTITGQSIEQDLGNIKLQQNVKLLQGVEVTGQKSAFTMGIDKKIFNVDRNLTSAGGTATDVLKSVPSVNVDLDGNVTVRNAAPTIFVDGKPSTLTLDQIPADAIESVELVTNPSAKYDAEGMSGILNIVLKKNRKAGFNGVVQAGIGNNNKYNGGGNISIRQGKFNVFANYNINANQSWGEGTTNRSNFGGKGADTSYLLQQSNSESKPLFQFGRFGVDYTIDNRNTISLSQNIVAGDFKNTEDLLSTFSNKAHRITRLSDRATTNDFNFRNYTTQLGFRHTFAKPEREWTADINYNTTNSGRDGSYVTQAKNAAGQALGQSLLQQNTSAGSTTFVTVQTDYTTPIGKKGKLETGVKTTLRRFSSSYDVYDKDTLSNHFIYNNQLSNNYKYNEEIYAGYANFANTMGNFGYQAGLRIEQYVYAGEIPGKATYKPTKATPGFFPSLFLSQKLKKDQELQLNYSRRVNRPNFFQLIPYRDYSDPQNQREGNPNLKPEYTNSLEFSYVKNWKTSNLLASVYFRNTNNMISTISTPIGADTLLTQFINANRSNSYGAELTMKNQVLKGWDLTTNVNLYQTDMKVNANGETFDNNGFSWMAKIISETKLPAGFTLQVNATYQAPTIALPASGGGRGPGGGGFMMIPTSAQGTIKGFSTVDMAVRKDFGKKKATSLTLSLSDVFNTREYELNQATPAFAQDYVRKRESRIVKLNFSYRFGKFDTALFKKKKASGGNDQPMGDPMQSF